MSFFNDFVEGISQLVGTIEQIDTSVRSITSSNTLDIVTNSIITPSVKPEVNPESAPKFTEVTLEPDPNNKIPVVYGKSMTKGIISDARLSADNLTLNVVYILSEATGPTIAGDPSLISLKRVFVNGYQATFDSDAKTVVNIRDTVGNTDTSVNGLIKVRYFYNGVDNQGFPNGLSGSGPDDLSSIFPGWGVGYLLTNLVFAVVSVTYDAVAGLTEWPEFSFEIENSMNQPGDVLYDYLTNKLYGAGLPVERINV